MLGEPFDYSDIVGMVRDNQIVAVHDEVNGIWITCTKGEFNRDNKSIAVQRMFELLDIERRQKEVEIRRSEIKLVWSKT